MIATFRPLIWLGPITPDSKRRSRSAFKASWSNTLMLLDGELRCLKAEAVIIEADFTESDIRLDGLPRANAKAPKFPGVRISFDSTVGRLAYQTDSCVEWQHNVRSIALGLEALRAVDRYGITAQSQQYAGFKALPPTPAEEVPFATADEALCWMREASGVEHVDGYTIKSLARLLATRFHPDRGGDPALWAKYDAARQLLEKEGLL